MASGGPWRVCRSASASRPDQTGYCPPMASYPVAGKSVLITGAARGIGAETARRLAAKGARVSLVGLEPEELEKVAAQCGPDAVWFETDVTDWDALERAASGTVDAFGGIDVVMA